MCKFCEQYESIFEKDIISDWILGWITDDVVKKDALTYDTWKIFIDRGFLRLVPKDDCQCIDHGERLKINYCPFCGEKQQQ